MAQLQWMEANFGSRLHYLTDEMCQINTQVSRIPRRQSHLSGFAPSPSLSPKASANEDDDAGDDVDDDVSSFGDDKMMTSQWLTLCHS